MNTLYHACLKVCEINKLQFDGGYVLDCFLIRTHNFLKSVDCLTTASNQETVEHVTRSKT